MFLTHYGKSYIFVALLLLVVVYQAACEGIGEVPSVTSYSSIQAAVDANPGKMVFVPPGEYHLDKPVMLTTDHSGLYGYGTLIQNNTAAQIIRIDHASWVRVQGLTLRRPEERMETTEEAIRGDACPHLLIENLKVFDNHSRTGSILVSQADYCTIRGCEVTNYKRISIDNRMDNLDLYGYSFRCIDGTGIIVRECKGTQVLNNRIIEKNLLATQEMKQKYGLGTVTERAAKLGRIAPKSVGESNYVNNWHQGSGLLVADPMATTFTLIEGNYIENAGQGIDIHSDYVICAYNIIDHAFLGMKAMHGSKHVIVNGNQFSHNDLLAIMMMPGSSSYPAMPAKDGKPAQPANYTRGNMIVNNIISDFGYGDEHVTWASHDPQGKSPSAIVFKSGQLAENPVLEDILIQGNIVYDTGRDEILENGVPKKEEPRYNYAVYVETNPPPKGLHFSGNLFHPGKRGISNVDLMP